MTNTDEAVQILYSELGCLPSEIGPINLLPFAVESDEANAFKREVCKAIVAVFYNAGLPMVRDVAPPPVEKKVTINCRVCSSTLLSAPIDKGVANIPAATVIAGMAKLNPECPHRPLTLEDQRRAIEQALTLQGE